MKLIGKQIVVELPEKRKILDLQSHYIKIRNKGWNDAIDACQAAVEAAGVEYGLDENAIISVIRKDGILYDETKLMVLKGYFRNANEELDFLERVSSRIAKAIKLAERELITRTTP